MLFAIERRVQLRSTSRTSFLGGNVWAKGSTEKTKFEQLVTPLLRSILQSLCGEPVDINPCQVSNFWNNIGKGGEERREEREKEGSGCIGDCIARSG